MAYFQGKVAFRQLIFGGYLVAITRILGFKAGSKPYYRSFNAIYGPVNDIPVISVAYHIGILRFFALIMFHILPEWQYLNKWK